MKKNTNLGSVNISLDVVSTVAGGAATECYGVVGMASRKALKDGFAELLKMENYTKGVVVRRVNGGLEIDLYIIVSFGVKISEVVSEAQKKVKYILEKSLTEEILNVNVFVQGVQVIG